MCKIALHTPIIQQNNFTQEIKAGKAREFSGILVTITYDWEIQVKHCSRFMCIFVCSRESF